MPTINGKNISARDLTADDPKFGSRFDASKPQMVVTYDDGRSEVVAKSAVAE